MLRRRGYTHDIPNTTHFQMPFNDASKALACTLFLRSIRFHWVILLHSFIEKWCVNVSVDAFRDAYGMYATLTVLSAYDEHA